MRTLLAIMFLCFVCNYFPRTLMCVVQLLACAWQLAWALCANL